MGDRLFNCAKLVMMRSELIDKFDHTGTKQISDKLSDKGILTTKMKPISEDMSVYGKRILWVQLESIIYSEDQRGCGKSFELLLNVLKDKDQDLAEKLRNCDVNAAAEASQKSEFSEEIDAIITASKDLRLTSKVLIHIVRYIGKFWSSAAYELGIKENIVHQAEYEKRDFNEQKFQVFNSWLKKECCAEGGLEKLLKAFASSGADVYWDDIKRVLESYQ